jgi:hypothetical protein
VGCSLNKITTATICHVFSLPFMFKSIENIGNTFPPIVFGHVTNLWVFDIIPFEHEFFVRIARFFPLLKNFSVLNVCSQLQVSNKLVTDHNQLYSVVEFPYLISLCLNSCDIDYVEQFLNETKTHLPRLMKLTVDYYKLSIVTENFRRDTTRLNCAKVKQLLIDKTVVHEKDFYVYFPLLSICTRYDYYLLYI